MAQQNERIPDLQIIVEDAALIGIKQFDARSGEKNGRKWEIPAQVQLAISKWGGNEVRVTFDADKVDVNQLAALAYQRGRFSFKANVRVYNDDYSLQDGADFKFQPTGSAAKAS